MGMMGLLKPEYLLRPSQLVRRLSNAISPPRAGRIVTRLPWGLPLEIDPNEEIGKAVLHLGLYDLVVTEVLWRLGDEGETALDIGANIGHMSSLLAKRMGSKGRVLSFEAHPEIVKDLQANVARWSSIVGEGVVQVFAFALSDAEGSIRFEAPPEFTRNRGTGRVVQEQSATTTAPTDAHIINVPCSTLDISLKDVGKVGVAKMDVEGHEEAVLRGGLHALKTGQVRDWIFEHHDAYPSPITNLFESHGYSVFQIQQQFFKPVLIEAAKPVVRSVWQPQNFLATRDPDRAKARMQSTGWQTLS